jgi:hypothetical integral membrane protein (TIGR02206 family)
MVGVKTDFQMFGALHGAILAAMLVVGAALTLAGRLRPLWQRPIHLTLGAILALSQIAWLIQNWVIEGWVFPGRMPLNLCDFTIVSTAIAALTLRQRIFEFSYYCGVAGAGMAVLTPDLYGPTASFRNVNFFIAHCGIVVTLIFLVGTRLMRPQPGSVGRTLLWLNVLGVLVGIFDWIFQTNYMFLREKPGGGSAMDFMGPWPVYLVVLDAVALVLFWLLWLPFRRSRIHLQS